MKLLVYAVALALLLPGMALTANADDVKKSDKKQEQVKKQKEVIYGRQLMTREEIAAYRSKMRAAKTPEEREKLRAEHHEQMKARAKERGVKLPDQPPTRGPGAGPGTGMGPGEGPGRRVGPGEGPGRRTGPGDGPGPRY